MSTTLTTITPPTRSQNPFEIARQQLIVALARIEVPAFSNFPVPSEFDAVRDYMRSLAGAVDETFAAIGHCVDDNSSSCVDLRLFLTPCTDAIDGNALWEVEKQKEAAVADHNEMIRSA